MSLKQLFATKSLEKLEAEVKGENRLRRILGPVSLTAVGVGAIIGAGIFVMTGRVAAQDAGPAVVLSFVVAGLGCLFAALCYAEFAALVPVAGSAYTYAYATLGEVFAWIIGWDLVLEYAMACACVASSWSKYLNELLFVVLQWRVPEYLCKDPASGGWLNLPALLITLAVTVVLVIGIRESATTNAILVAVKIGVVLFVIGVGIAYVSTKNWTGVPPSERIRASDLAIPELAEKQVKEHTLTPVERNARIDQVVREIESVVKERTGRERTSGIQRVVRGFYDEVGRLSKDETDQRIRKLISNTLALSRVQYREKELQGPVSRGELSKQEADEQLKQLEEKLHFSKLEREEQRLQAEVKAGKLTRAQHDAQLQQVRTELAQEKATSDPYLPRTAADKRTALHLLALVDTEGEKKLTDKWGLLGLLGLNRWLVPIDDAVRSPYMPYGLAGIVFGAAIVFFAYIGFDAVSTQAEEAKLPQRDVPIAILASLVLCTILYIGVAAVLTGMLPYNQIDSEAAVAAAFRQKGEETNNGLLKLSAGLIAIGAIAGMTSVLMVTFLSQARIFLAMARDRLLPPAIFAAIHPRFRTPHRSTMLTGGVIALVAAFTPITKLEEMVNIGTLMAFVIVCAAVLLLRIRRPEAQRPFRTPALFLVAPLGILVNLIMMLFLPLDTWIRLVVWLVVGLIIYGLYGLRNSVIGQELRGLIPSMPGVSEGLPNGPVAPKGDGEPTDAIQPPPHLHKED
jgi:amino acid transporter